MAHIRAKLHDVSNNDTPRDTGSLITYAIAAVLLDEIDDQGYKVSKVLERAGISGRSWSNYAGGHTPAVPLTQWAKVAGALGLRTSEVLARAEDRLDRLDDTDIELLVGLSGPAALMVIRERGRERRGGAESEDPPDRAREGARRAG